MSKIVFILLLLCFVTSCSKDIEVEQPDYKPKIVVDGWIENNSFAHVILTKSSPFLTEYDSASIRNTFLNYAKVTVTSSKGESEILTLFREDIFFPPFVYRSIKIKGEVGVTYFLKVEANGKIVESTTTIPQEPVVNYVKTVARSDTSMYISIGLQDKAISSDYYYTQIKVKNVDTNYHPSVIPLFNDLGMNGEEIVHAVYRSVQPDPFKLIEEDTTRNLLPYEFYKTDTVYLRISAVDYDSYNVLSDIYLDQKNSSNPFSFVNKSTSSNIIGGIGRWTGFATKEYLVVD